MAVTDHGEPGAPSSPGAPGGSPPGRTSPFERLERLPRFGSFDPADPFDPASIELSRPAPARPVVERWAARTRPWVDWFGVRRLVAAAVTVVAVVAGGWWLLRSPAPSTEAGLPRATSTGPPTSAPSGSGPASPAAAAATSTTAAATSVVVDVAGAVAHPGVYELAAGARANAAISAAGGATAEADLTAVNLAAPLVDGAQLYVPVVGAPPRAGAPPGPSPPTTAAGPLDINRATAAQLDALPGIGPSTAAAIVAHRDDHGPYASVDDLEDVRGIGPAKLEAIRQLVTV